MTSLAEITFKEVQQTMEADKMKAIEELTRKFEEEKKAAIAETKLKQWVSLFLLGSRAQPWLRHVRQTRVPYRKITDFFTFQCANCGKEAVFYCCWNTSYCDYPCQQKHWPQHQATCAQIRQQPAAEPVAQVSEEPSFSETAMRCVRTLSESRGWSIRDVVSAVRDGPESSIDLDSTWRSDGTTGRYRQRHLHVGFAKRELS